MSQSDGHPQFPMFWWGMPMTSQHCENIQLRAFHIQMKTYNYNSYYIFISPAHLNCQRHIWYANNYAAPPSSLIGHGRLICASCRVLCQSLRALGRVAGTVNKINDLLTAGVIHVMFVPLNIRMYVFTLCVLARTTSTKDPTQRQGFVLAAAPDCLVPWMC